MKLELVRVRFIIDFSIWEMQVGLSILRLLLAVSRPRTCVLGNISNSITYRSIEQYPFATNVPGMLILHIDSPIYFSNTSYLRERYMIIINYPHTRIIMINDKVNNIIIGYQDGYMKRKTE